MRGRPRKPAALCDVEGDTRKLGAKKLRQRIASEPKAPSGLPTCPDHLQGLARKTYQSTAEELQGMGLDRRPDGPMLEGYSIAYAQAVEADRLIGINGLVIEHSAIDEESGEKVILRCVANPAVAISRASWKQVLAFGAQFGLSPVARARITIEKPDTGEQDLMKILSAPRPPVATPQVH